MGFTQEKMLEDDYMITAYGRKPVEFVSGNGMKLYDDAGKEYLDFLSGIGAVSLGHANPAVTKAISEQANKLLHVSNYFYIEGRGELAKQLSDLLNQVKQEVKQAEEQGSEKQGVDSFCSPPSHWKIFFGNSGAEANEAAIKLARKYGNQNLNGATTIITAVKSFHGRTLATTAATGQSVKQEAFFPMPAGFVHVPLNDIQALKAAIDQPTNGPICAVMLECIQGEGGVWPCTDAYLQEVSQLAAEHKLLLIIDEVQTGFCRTGLPFSFMHAGIRPDVVTMAKGIGNGFPLGALAATGIAADIFVPGEHGSTFGGSALAVAAAAATVQALLNSDLAVNAAKIGEYLAKKLAKLPHVTEVRGKGLMLGLSLDVPIAADVADQALDQGFVIANIGADILRFLPPLICSETEIDALINTLQQILEQK
jgi:acetylornithine aminotransferase